MKPLLSISILLFVLFSFQTSIAQETSTFDLKRSIKLTPEDIEAQNIKLSVYEKTSFVGLNISCKVILGNLKVEIYDPNGNKQGEFAVESQILDKSNGTKDNFYEKETVEGQIEKFLKNPMRGDWIVKLIPIKTYAEVEINSRFTTTN
ncbi:hypothetical protein WNY78_05160 [Psychroserpens sp. AS72]|uniref:hypothetical protein n=1 Tax=Psychroserpens sp. AS72 TaxID=3135775 RepID=UPI00317B77F3